MACLTVSRRRKARNATEPYEPDQPVGYRSEQRFSLEIAQRCRMSSTARAACHLWSAGEQSAEGWAGVVGSDGSARWVCISRAYNRSHVGLCDGWVAGVEERSAVATGSAHARARWRRLLIRTSCMQTPSSPLVGDFQALVDDLQLLEQLVDEGGAVEAERLRTLMRGPVTDCAATSALALLQTAHNQLHHGYWKDVHGSCELRSAGRSRVCLFRI